MTISKLRGIFSQKTSLFCKKNKIVREICSKQENFFFHFSPFEVWNLGNSSVNNQCHSTEGQAGSQAKPLQRKLQSHVFPPWCSFLHQSLCVLLPLTRSKLCLRLREPAEPCGHATGILEAAIHNIRAGSDSRLCLTWLPALHPQANLWNFFSPRVWGTWTR